MKLKSLLTLVALSAAGTASAVVLSENTLCRIRINSTAKSTIVAIPLAKIGDGSSVPVTEFVLTDNLSAGDTLLHLKSTAADGTRTWEAWTIDNGAWKPMIISENSVTTMTAGAADATLSRGDAVWLNRSATDKPFFIYGQVASASATSTAAAGTATAPAYTLMGNAKTVSVTLSSLAYANGTAPSVGDKIVIGNPDSPFGYNEYTWQTAMNTQTPAWCEEGLYTNSENKTRIGWVKAETASLGPGVGFWYISVGGTPTIQW